VLKAWNNLVSLKLGLSHFLCTFSLGSITWWKSFLDQSLSFERHIWSFSVSCFLCFPDYKLEIIVNSWYFFATTLVMCPLIGGVLNPVCCILRSKGKRYKKFWHVVLKAWSVVSSKLGPRSHLWCAFSLDSVTWWIVFLDQSRSSRGIYGLLVFLMFSWL
jgi:hypothetical protein